MTIDIKHEVNVISVLVSPERGVLLHQADSGKWGFPGSEDLVPGEDWESTQLRGLNRDLGNIEFENVSILHLESYPGGTVGPDAKFGVFVLGKISSAQSESESIRWAKGAEEIRDLDLVHVRVADLVEKALRNGQVSPQIIR